MGNKSFRTHAFTGCDMLQNFLFYAFLKLLVKTPQIELVTLEWFTMISLKNVEVEGIDRKEGSPWGGEGRAWLPRG